MSPQEKALATRLIRWIRAVVNTQTGPGASTGYTEEQLVEWAVHEFGEIKDAIEKLD